MKVTLRKPTLEETNESLHCLLMAVYKNVIINPSNGLDEKQFMDMQFAHAQALNLLRHAGVMPTL